MRLRETRLPAGHFRRARAILLLALAALATATLRMLAAPLAAQAPTPEAHFGFRMGTDRRLATAESIEQYFQLVAAQTDRVRTVDIGSTTEGHRTIAAIVSSPENIRNLDAIRAANQRLADPRTIAPDEAAPLAGAPQAVLA